MRYPLHIQLKSHSRLSFVKKLTLHYIHENMIWRAWICMIHIIHYLQAVSIFDRNTCTPAPTCNIPNSHSCRVRSRASANVHTKHTKVENGISVRVFQKHISSPFWCLKWILTEALDLYLYDSMHCATATWVAEWVISWVDNCLND